MQVGDATWCKYSRCKYRLQDCGSHFGDNELNKQLSSEREAGSTRSSIQSVGDPEAGPRSSVKEKGQGERERVMKGRMGRDQETKKDVEDDVRCRPETRKARLSLCVWSCLSRLNAQGSTGWTCSKVPTMEQGMADGLILKRWGTAKKRSRSDRR